MVVNGFSTRDKSTKLVGFGGPAGSLNGHLNMVVIGSGEVSPKNALKIQVYPPVAMENGPFEDVFPIENGDFPWLCWFTRG